jgi:hypothetical protein
MALLIGWDDVVFLATKVYSTKRRWHVTVLATVHYALTARS